MQSEDNDSDTSDAETTDSFQLRDRSEQDPLGLAQRGPELEEGECRPSSPEAMDQDEVLGHNAHLEEGSTSDAGIAFGQITDSQSKAMDATGLYLDSEAFSGQPMETQVHGIPVATLRLIGVKEKMRRPDVVDCTPRYGPTRSLYTGTSLTGGTKGKT